MSLNEATELGQLATRQRRRTFATIMTRVEQLDLSEAQRAAVKGVVADQLAIYHDFVLDAIGATSGGPAQVWNTAAMDLLEQIAEGQRQLLGARG